MSSLLTHRGYEGTVEFSTEDQLLFGKVLHIDSLLMYEADSVPAIQRAFQETVDDYLAHCAQHNVAPNKTYKGSLNVRIGPDRHRALAQMAARAGTTLNEIICRSVDSALAPNITTHEHNHTHHVFVVDTTSPTQSMASAGAAPVIFGPQWHPVKQHVQ